MNLETSLRTPKRLVREVAMCIRGQLELPVVDAINKAAHLDKVITHMMEALKCLAVRRCKKKNCGTVCLCGPCHARKALEYFEPDWRP